ncbi:F0F1 ATP synthase subunit A [Apilactobacillus apinorum]|uniref:ATP synthase subunit a n=1 Tax=Apilactobacillus apinorum TaxID=1218495 RepID=A0ABP9ZJF2_9LACO|nr:F0F1 ATP synthase subunit A [Apilactobacillus apinorum]KOY69192.1 ATP synthase subunit a [Apilactobacillus apinorum]CAI2646355.1 atpB ATP synthase subunit a [Apilactobacillus apinorum]
MNDPISTFKLFGLTFNIGNMVAVTVAAVFTFLLVFICSRRLQLVPSGKQNFLEAIVDFTNGIVKGSISGSEANAFGLYAFVLFLFIFISNQMGLLFQVDYSGVTYVKSPTADPIVALTLAAISLSLAHFLGVSKLGFKGYFVGSYFKPFKLLFPLNVFEELANFLTLGLRLYGNIFAGELLLGMVTKLAFSMGAVSLIPSVFVAMIWDAFSIFIGSVQAFVFVTLTFVYISQKLEPEE